MANLFIAMGGSGLKTVREIREKHRDGDHFLFIDTDTNDLVDAKGNPFSEREKVVLNIYRKLNKQNQHKMQPIPVCAIPEGLK